MMVRDFQSVIGKETREQMIKKEDRLPDYLLACVGGGSNAMGMFHPFVKDDSVKMIGVEAAGEGVDTDRHCATLSLGCPGALHGSMSYLLQNEDGQVQLTHSISAWLDYPGVGPEHSYLKDSGRVEYVYATDAEALDAFQFLSETEGIIPALESAHAVAHARKLVPTLGKNDLVVICLSGRGDKDVDMVAKSLEVEL